MQKELSSLVASNFECGEFEQTERALVDR